MYITHANKTQTVRSEHTITKVLRLYKTGDGREQSATVNDLQGKPTIQKH